MSENRKEGFQAVIDMLNVMEGPERDKLLANLARQDPALAAELEKGMFTFEELLQYESRGIQELLRLTPRETLILALRTASEALKAHLFKNLSKRAVEALHEEVMSSGPRRRSEVEAAQRDILSIAKNLMAEGKLRKAEK
jgi:flagellar motor switch protein FliG